MLFKKPSPFLPIRQRAVLDRLALHHAHNVLLPDETLNVGCYLQSLDGTSLLGSRWIPTAVLVMQPDGDLVLYKKGVPCWAAGTASVHGAYAVMDPHGALIVYDANHTPVWSSGSKTPGARVVVDATGASICTPEGVCGWSTKNQTFHGTARNLFTAPAAVGFGFDPDLNPGDAEDPWDPVAGALEGGIQASYSNPVTGEIQQEFSCLAFPAFQGEALSANATLGPEQAIVSQNGQYTCKFQTDGNLVVYDQAGHVQWASNTNGKGATRCVLQSDGNLVLYIGADDSKPIWDSGTRGSGLFLVMQNDGNLVIYDPSHAPKWASNDHKGGDFMGIHIDVANAVSQLIGKNGPAAVAAFNQAASALSKGISVSAVLNAVQGAPPAQQQGAAAAAALVQGRRSLGMGSFGPNVSDMQKAGGLLFGGANFAGADLSAVTGLKPVMQVVAGHPDAVAGAQHVATVIQAKKSIWAKIKAWFMRKPKS